MNLLLIANLNNTMPSTVEECTSRTELFLILLKHYLENSNINTTIKKCYPYLTNKNIIPKLHNYGNYNHIIFVDQYGFNKKTTAFYDYLKTVTNGTISVICDSHKFSSFEDITFTPDLCIYNSKLVQSYPLLEPSLYIPRKIPNTITILLNKPSELVDLYTTEIPSILGILEEHIANQDSFTFNIGLLDKQTITWIKPDGDIIETVVYDSYIDFILQISTVNVFITSGQFFDNTFLYELSLCNGLIVSKLGHLEAGITKELNAMIYKDYIVWDDIFNTFIKHNSRQLILSKFNPQDIVQNIVDKLNKTTVATRELAVQTETKTNTIFGLNIHNKSKPTITKMQVIEQPKVPVKPTKKPVFLQSTIQKN